jgi:uncharacterized protein (TIGR00730 family)
MTPARPPRFSLCVYCGSRLGGDPAFIEAAKTVGQWIGDQQGQLVFGGGRSGLMGVVADATLRAGGRVVGIIPQALVDKEHAHTGCTELHVVETMHQRKEGMAHRADAFLALPGGIGTFEELFEVWTWRQLGYHHKPIGLLNTNGYYDDLERFIKSAIQAKLMDPWQLDLMHWGKDTVLMLEGLIKSIPLRSDANATH